MDSVWEHFVCDKLVREPPDLHGRRAAVPQGVTQNFKKFFRTICILALKELWIKLRPRAFGDIKIYCTLQRLGSDASERHTQTRENQTYFLIRCDLLSAQVSRDGDLPVYLIVIVIH